MTSDLELVEGQHNDDISFTLNKADGTPDDLTLYANVTLRISAIDYSSNIQTLVSGIDAEIVTTDFATGILVWRPSVGKPVPAFGWYWVQITRSTFSPVRKFLLHVTRKAT